VFTLTHPEFGGWGTKMDKALVAQGVANRLNSRSKYGTKKPKAGAAAGGKK